MSSSYFYFAFFSFLPFYFATLFRYFIRYLRKRLIPLKTGSQASGLSNHPQNPYQHAHNHEGEIFLSNLVALFDFFWLLLLLLCWFFGLLLLCLHYRLLLLRILLLSKAVTARYFYFEKVNDENSLLLL